MIRSLHQYTGLDLKVLPSLRKYGVNICSPNGTYFTQSHSNLEEPFSLTLYEENLLKIHDRIHNDSHKDSE